MIYQIKNRVNGKKYIGRTVYTVEKRFKTHVTQASKKTLLGCAILKYGAEAFELSVIEECDNSVVGSREIYWIKELKTHASEGGYNLTYGGDGGMLGFKMSEETRRLMSEKSKGRVFSEESKEKMRQKALGRKFSEADRKKMSESAKRKPPVTQETIEKRRAKLIGQKRTQEQNDRRLHAQLAVHYHHTEETKKKLSEINVGKKVSEETKKKISEAGLRRPKRHVVQLDKNMNVIQEFTSVKEAAEKTGILAGTIYSNILYGNLSRHSKCSWKYLD